MIDYDVDNNASIYTIHTDHLGTPQQVSNEQQEIVWQGEYDAFGQVTVKAVPKNNTQDMQAKRKGWLPTLMNSANAAESVTSEPFEFNLRFAGQYEDSESGYYYNLHRYYNPETGRYLTSDPIGLNGGLNTYGYAGQNPVQAVDPWGLLPQSSGGWSNTNRLTGITYLHTNFDLLPEIEIPTLKGWQDYQFYNNKYHEYNMKVRVTGLSDMEINNLESFIVNHPTPNTATRAATKRGTNNPATPNFGPFASIAANGVSPDDVYTFLRVGKNGRKFVVNVTQSNHSLRYGIVIRGLECVDGKTIMHNYGKYPHI